jgi:TetR/AcrR family transcriptional repressor of nem operon
MKVSREQMAENRTRILDTASRLFRDRGFEVVTVSEIMKAAGLTHGGFYGHFASKDDLIAQAVAHSLAPAGSEAGDIGAWMDSYLSPYHRDRAATGCPSAGFAGLLPHQSPEARTAMTDGLRRQIDQLSTILPVPEGIDPRTAAIGSWAAMVGAVILARAVDDTTLSDEVLTRTRAWIDQRNEMPA